MLKYLSAALVAAGLFAAPVLSTSAEAAQTTVKVVTVKPVAKKVVIVKKPRFAHVRSHVKHVRVWHPNAHRTVFVVKKPAHRSVLLVKKPARIVVKKTIITR